MHSAIAFPPVVLAAVAAPTQATVVILEAQGPNIAVRWAPNIAVAWRIWLPGASIMEDY